MSNGRRREWVLYDGPCGRNYRIRLPDFPTPPDDAWDAETRVAVLMAVVQEL
jgi:hypothetical protein